MSTGGIGGPVGIGGPTAGDGVGETSAVDEATDVEGADQSAAVDGAASTAATDSVEELAAAIDAGAISPQAALDQLIEASMSPELAAVDRTELRALIGELAENDPHFAALLARLG